MNNKYIHRQYICICEIQNMIERVDPKCWTVKNTSQI